jgi:hypothetical protein
MDNEQDMFERMVRNNCPWCQGATSRNSIYTDHHTSTVLEWWTDAGDIEHVHRSISGHTSTVVCKSSGARKTFPKRSDTMNRNTK